MLGFCVGGSLALACAALNKRLVGVAALYGQLEYPLKNEKGDAMPSPLALAPDIQIPVTAHFGTADPVLGLSCTYVTPSRSVC
ncbi:hypothetical protein ARTHRO9AX_220071 [Arthrobacter sp. 9AX]|uniref:dienelactone hydrolase family protein n=1 Tax=Arthrobacter sp. 9AX TaxID=2653131 RepID=UPI0012F46A26|nr:hypothetical protein ARTHRO9AX_220071 [Arthrobacter sp. 9AX]